MTLDITKPNDTTLISELKTYIRENRIAINALSYGNDVGNIGFTDLTLQAGSTSMSINIDLGTYGLEVVKLSSIGPSNISAIYGGTEGQIKIFVFQDPLSNFIDGNVRLNGSLYLNQLPALTPFNARQDDVIALVNFDGDGATTQGYWKELFRILSVK